MKKRKVTLLSSACLLALLVAGLLWLFLDGDAKQQCRLPDSSVLTLKQVTYNERHLMRVGNRLRDYLVTILSEKIARKLECHYVAAGGTNQLVFWLQHEGVSGGSAPRLCAATFDEHGCEFRLTAVADTPYQSLKQRLLVASLDRFPRRSKTIGLRLYQAQTNGGYSKLTEFVVPNPDRRSYPVWQPEPFPITKTVSNVAVTLLEVKGGVYGRSHPPHLPEPGQDTGFLLKFRVSENGKPTSAWSLAGITGLADACGQAVGQGGYAGGGSRDKGEITTVIGGGLCLEEPALRLQAEFAREKDFPSQEVWMVKGLPVPDESSFSTFDATNTIHGVQLRVTGIYGKKCPGPDPRRSLPSYAALNLVTAHLSPDLELKLVQVMDDQGRNAWAGARSSSATNHAFGLKLSEDARSVDVTFAVTKRITVEFLAKPSRMTAAEIEKLRKDLGYQ